MDRIRSIISQATGIPLADVTESIGFGLHPLWDSVAQIAIIMSLEDEYGITIADDSVASLTSVSGIAQFLSTSSAG